MTPERARQLKAEAQEGIAKEKASHAERMAAYRALLEAADQIIHAVEAARAAPVAKKPAPRKVPLAHKAAASRSTPNTTSRTTEILKAAAPKPLSPRDVLEYLQLEEWATESSNPINVVRNTLAELARKQPMFIRRDELADKTATYTWIGGDA